MKAANGNDRSSQRSSSEEISASREKVSLNQQVASIRARREQTANLRRQEVAKTVKPGPFTIPISADDIEGFEGNEPGRFARARKEIVVGAAEHDWSEAQYVYMCADAVTRMINAEEEPKLPNLVWASRVLRAATVTMLHPPFTFPEHALCERYDGEQREAEAESKTLSLQLGRVPEDAQWHDGESLGDVMEKALTVIHPNGHDAEEAVMLARRAIRAICEEIVRVKHVVMPLEVRFTYEAAPNPELAHSTPVFFIR